MAVVHNQPVGLQASGFRDGLILHHGVYVCVYIHVVYAQCTCHSVQESRSRSRSRKHHTLTDYPFGSDKLSLYYS
jgi:hypothetical protein